jgi:hypothetical protein
MNVFVSEACVLPVSDRRKELMLCVVISKDSVFVLLSRWLTSVFERRCGVYLIELAFGEFDVQKNFSISEGSGYLYVR